MWVGTRALACACERVALLIQHETRSYIAICGLSGSTTFFDIVINGTIFGKKITEYKMCILIFSTALFVTFTILRRIQRDIVMNLKTALCKIPVIFVAF